MNPLARFFRDGSAPSVAVELAAHRISAARVEARPGGTGLVSHAVEPLPDRALVASLTAPNLRDRAAVLTALNRALDGVGRARRVGLVVPDPVAKVSLVRFDQVPARPDDLDQLIRWQVKKAVPFPLDEAEVSYVRGEQSDGGQAFVVTIARRDVVMEYEALLAEAGAQAGIVDLATLNVANLVLAGPAPPTGDWLLVNVAPDCVSLAILRGPHLIFFRSRGADAEDTLADLVHQAAMYYEDRLEGSGFRKVVLCGASGMRGGQTPDAGQIRRSLEMRLGVRVETADASAALSSADRVAADALLADGLAPLVGLLLRERVAA
jgi:Tfp pilus assembly PilM family ATPase